MYQPACSYNVWSIFYYPSKILKTVFYYPSKILKSALFHCRLWFVNGWYAWLTPWDANYMSVFLQCFPFSRLVLLHLECSSDGGVRGVMNVFVVNYCIYMCIIRFTNIITFPLLVPHVHIVFDHVRRCDGKKIWSFYVWYGGFIWHLTW